MIVPASAPFPEGATLSVELFAEPLTGWAMVGVGATWPSPDLGPLTVELHYDGQARLDQAIPFTAPGYTFGVQIPREPSAQTLRVVIRSATRETTRELAIEDIKPRATPAASQAAQPTPRWLSPLKTLGRAVATGEGFRAAWWQARVRRYRDAAVRVRQRARDKYQLGVGRRSRTVYDAYREVNSPTAGDLARMRERAAKFRYQPTFSVLCPVYNVEPRWLLAAVESVRHQAYTRWELCLADDASTDAATLACLQALPQDSRIKLVRRPENGHICAATNSAADLATGEFVVMLDNDDELAPQALFRFAEFLQSQPDADLIYTDEDKLDAAGRPYDPQFKPDWSPELLLSYNYINHLTCVRRGLFEKVGRYRLGYHGAQDYDLMLRLTEASDRVHHIPEVLYHWRAVESSSALSAGVKPIIHDAVRRGLGDAVVRRGLPLAVTTPKFARELNLPAHGLDLARPQSSAVSVAAIIRGKPEDAARTLRALRATTAGSALTTYLVLDTENRAESLNRIAAGRTEDRLLFLEAGVEPLETGWLSKLLAYAAIPGVGAVGGLILGEDERIVSAGTVVTDHPRDAFGGVTPDPVSYYFQAESARNVTAPGHGCLLTDRGHFDRVGGFDAERFGASLYDVDYALRLAGQGLRCVHVGEAVLRWRSPDAGRRDAPSERVRLRQAYGAALDPYHNVNLDPSAPFTVRVDRPTGDVPQPTTRPPVLFATHNLTALEGAPKILADIAVGLHARGQISASLFAPAPGAASEAFRAAGLACHAVSQPYRMRYTDGQWTPAEYEACQTDLRAILRRVKPAVVVANTIGMFPLVEAAARLGIPAQLLVHESYAEPAFQTAFSPYGRSRCERALLLADRVVFGSRSCADLYARLDGRKNFTAIHYGLDRAPIEETVRSTTRDQAATGLGADPSPVRVIAVGTICERKAQHVLVEATAKLVARRRDFRCLFVGAREGLPYLSYVRHLIRARGLDDIVEVVPETDQVRRYYRSADIFACTSYVEAFSLAVLEAEAFGLPIVSTPCGGLDEQVVWGRNALRFDFGDADQLAGQLQRLIGDAALRERMGRESLAMSTLHPTPTQMLDRFAETVHGAVARAARGN